MSIVQASKRQRTQATDLALATSSTVTLSGPTPGDLILAEDDEEPRTSSLQAPIMLLSGQEAAVYCFGFSPAGDVCASAGVEKAIYLSAAARHPTLQSHLWQQLLDARRGAAFRLRLVQL